jgi:GNAT superfamily N-acetyltransferase
LLRLTAPADNPAIEAEPVIQMTVLIEAIRPNDLAEYAEVPMVCNVDSMLVVEEIDGGLGGLRLSERPVKIPYTKNYDAYADGGPLDWPQRFDISQWGLWIARDGGQTVGGAAVAWQTPGIELLDGRSDLAVLWDIRVKETNRRQGVGTALLRAATDWAKSRDCSLLKIGTQNVNVAACRFYSKLGCVLGRIDRLAYRQCADLASEVMLVWHLDLRD